MEDKTNRERMYTFLANYPQIAAITACYNGSGDEGYVEDFSYLSEEGQQVILTPDNEEGLMSLSKSTLPMLCQAVGRLMKVVTAMFLSMLKSVKQLSITLTGLRKGRSLPMANPYHHALSSVNKWGGKAEDYLSIHDWFDESKAFLADFRHRALRHHAEGIFLCEKLFGHTLTNSDGRVIPIRWIGEQHVNEDLGRIPSACDWLRCIKSESWMNRSRKLSKELLEER
jgi:hypothetical protein